MEVSAAALGCSRREMRTLVQGGPRGWAGARCLGGQGFRRGPGRPEGIQVSGGEQPGIWKRELQWADTKLTDSLKATKRPQKQTPSSPHPKKGTQASVLSPNPLAPENGHNSLQQCLQPGTRRGAPTAVRMLSGAHPLLLHLQESPHSSPTRFSSLSKPRTPGAIVPTHLQSLQGSSSFCCGKDPQHRHYHHRTRRALLCPQLRKCFKCWFKQKNKEQGKKWRLSGKWKFPLGLKQLEFFCCSWGLAIRYLIRIKPKILPLSFQITKWLHLREDQIYTYKHCHMFTDPAQHSVSLLAPELTGMKNCKF